MSRCIVFVRGMHLEWSMRLEAPASSGMTRDRMELHLAARGLAAEPIRTVLDTDERTGAALIDDPEAPVARLEVLSRNSMGAAGEPLAAREVAAMLTGPDGDLF